MTSESVALRLHTAATADAALASDLRAAYRGRHDVLDALWWRAHPRTVTPGGRADPATEMPRLQAAAYSRPSPDESLFESERRLRDLLAQLQQDDADLDSVLLMFPDGAAIPGGIRSGGALPLVTPRAPGDAGATGGSSRALRRRTRRRSVLLIAAGALIGGSAVAAVATLLPRGGGASGPGAEAAASVSPGLIALFDQPQIPDQETIDFGPEFRRDSIHEMFVERETSSFVYVARRGDDLYCVILRTQGQQGASVCVGLAELARRGMDLTATVPVNPFTLGKDSLKPAGALADVTIRISTDGVVSSETAPHPTD